MEVLLLFVALLQEPVSSTLYGPRFLTGRVGGSVTHQCFYSITPTNKHDRKYWCKRANNGVCYTVISTTGYISKGHTGRVSLEDNPQHGTFMVTMTQLKSSDTGTYRCGIGSTNQDLHVSMNLTVSEDMGAPRLAELLRGELRGSITVPCPPGDTRDGKKRFWCKVGSTGCALIADTDGYVAKSYEGRIFITPQESSGAFKVLINGLRKEDAGLYRCGTGSLGVQDSPQAVALQVTTASTYPRRPKFLSSTVGGSLSVRCHHDPQGSYETKYLCRWQAASCSLLVDMDGFVHQSYEGRIRIASSDQEKGTYTVVMSHLREDDAGWYWCGARSGHTEHTSAVKLLIQKGTCTSQNPETCTLGNPILPSSLPAYSTPTQRSTLGNTYTAGTTYTVGTTYTAGTTYTVGTVGTAGTKYTAGTTYTVGTTYTAGTTYTVGTVGTAGTKYTAGTTDTSTPGTFVTSHSSIYHQSSSGESHLLPVVLSALVLLIFITITILVLTKIKLQKETGQERSATGHAEAVLVQAGLNPAKEQMEETGSPNEANGCKTDSSKCRIIYAILGRFRRTSLCGSYGEKNTFQQNSSRLEGNKQNPLLSNHCVHKTRASLSKAEASL